VLLVVGGKQKSSSNMSNQLGVVHGAVVVAQLHVGHHTLWSNVRAHLTMGESTVLTCSTLLKADLALGMIVWRSILGLVRAM
jgi:hypothetical protein